MRPLEHAACRHRLSTSPPTGHCRPGRGFPASSRTIITRPICATRRLPQPTPGSRPMTANWGRSGARGRRRPRSPKPRHCSPGSTPSRRPDCRPPTRPITRSCSASSTISSTARCSAPISSLTRRAARYGVQSRAIAWSALPLRSAADYDNYLARWRRSVPLLREQTAIDVDYAAKGYGRPARHWPRSTRRWASRPIPTRRSRPITNPSRRPRRPVSTPRNWAALQARARDDRRRRHRPGDRGFRTAYTSDFARNA